jgi:hypothetical protein
MTVTGPVISDADQLLGAVADGAVTFNPSSANDVERLLCWVGRNTAPWLLYRLRDRVDPELLPVLVPSAWQMAEWPTRVLRSDRWRHLWQLSGYVHNGRWVDRPTMPVRLYRGTDARHRYGWSWTAERATAEWFAARKLWVLLGHQPGAVWTALVPPMAMLATITDGREPEIVVDPKLLREARVEIEPVAELEAVPARRSHRPSPPVEA